MKPSLLLIALVITCNSFSQSDTTLIYFNQQKKETTKDSASFVMKYTRQGDLWHGAAYDLKSGILTSEGNYAEKNIKTPVGHFKNYDDQGRLDYTADYTDGKRSEATGYYKNGNKRYHVIHEETGNKVTGWDESGKEIKGFIFEKEARFRGGLDAWKRFLENNLNAGVAADAGAPPGQYKVAVQFVINKEGYVANIEPIAIPAGCKPCVAEVRRLLSASPQWEPVIQYNVPVIYQAIQNVTFQVAEEKRKRRKN